VRATTALETRHNIDPAISTFSFDNKALTGQLNHPIDFNDVSSSGKSTLK
jgi:hypothetical protein